MFPISRWAFFHSEQEMIFPEHQVQIHIYIIYLFIIKGWGGSAPSTLIGENLKGLKKLIKKWVNAKVRYFDIWEVEVETLEVF